MNELLRFQGLSTKCYSSGVELVLDKETFEAVCNKCKNNSNMYNFYVRSLRYDFFKNHTLNESATPCLSCMIEHALGVGCSCDYHQNN